MHIQIDEKSQTVVEEYAKQNDHQATKVERFPPTNWYQGKLVCFLK